jgi:hypothetical protein
VDHPIGTVRHFGEASIDGFGERHTVIGASANDDAAMRHFPVQAAKMPAIVRQKYALMITGILQKDWVLGFSIRKARFYGELHIVPKSAEMERNGTREIFVGEKPRHERYSPSVFSRIAVSISEGCAFA